MGLQKRVGVALLLLTGILNSGTLAQVRDNPEMSKIFEADQKDRENSSKLSIAQWEQVNSRDAQRRKQVRELLEVSALQTGKDFENAAFVFMHGDQPQDYLMGHVLASVAIARGNTRARWISAATLDRYLRSVQQSQVFGTQFTWQGAQGSTRVDFHEGTWTQDPYAKDLIPDSLRREFCVSSRTEQEHHLVVLRSGKYDPYTSEGCH